MNNVITFPVARRKPHVVLLRDHAWNEYRVEPVGCIAPAGTTQWTSDYGEALDLLMGMGERLDLPMIDATPERNQA